MNRSFLLLLSLAACARYTPQPLDLVAGPADYATRRLDDSTVTAALTRLGAPAQWNPERFAEAAWWLRPERMRSEAEVAAAESALVSAGARPDPGASVELERSFSGTDATSPWAVGGGPSVTFEFGGKRAARIVRAQAGVVAARAALSLERRQVRERVRSAALLTGLTARTRDQAELRAALADSLLEGFRHRFADGAISRFDLTRAEVEREAAWIRVLGTQREVRLAGAALATAIGVPLEGLEGIPLQSDAFPRCAALLLPGRDSLRSAALAHRPEMGVALAAYLAAEAEVRMEVAQSWPDLVIGPGVLFDHGVGKWTIGFGLPSLALNRRRGPIREAEARRTISAARVLEAQEALLREVDASVVACQAADRELGVLVARTDSTAARESVSRDAFARGEIGSVEVLQARLLTLTIAEERDVATARMLQAALQLQSTTGP